MTQEEKQLLLTDLCARVPYGVKLKANNEECIREVHYIRDEDVYVREYRNLPYWIDTIKPYLRPMSSMTEEETKTYQSLQDTACSYHYEFGDIVDDFLYFDNDISLDYLNSIHIDYRGLIPMGLALEAKEGMYKTE